MFNHVFGRLHREKFLHDSHPNDPEYDAIKTIYR
jgi:hypothetical protein